MADAKISALPASTTPLAGSEVLPIVQSGTTKQVSVDNLTIGRAVEVASLKQSGKSTPYTLGVVNLPFILVSSGTMGDNGALSGITALPFETTYGIYPETYAYFPANAIFAGSAAGWYYTVFATTTTATVYNNVYTSGVPIKPASPTPFVTTGPGAYTQTTGAYINGLALSIPPLETTSVIKVQSALLNNNSVNQKYAIFRLNGQNMVPSTISNTTNTTFLLDLICTNKASKAKQFVRSTGGSSNMSVLVPTNIGVDTSTVSTFNIGLYLSNATDTIALYNTVVEIIK